MIRTWRTVAFVALLSQAGTANAELVSGPDIIPAPDSVFDNAPGAENTSQQAFNERLGVLLPEDISVDEGGSSRQGRSSTVTWSS